MAGLRPSEAALDAALLSAHARGDTGSLVSLYARAADLAEAGGRPDAADFYRTHAYVFALERGDARAADLHRQLKANGKEE